MMEEVLRKTPSHARAERIRRHVTLLVDHGTLQRFWEVCGKRANVAQCRRCGCLNSNWRVGKSLKTHRVLRGPCQMSPRLTTWLDYIERVPDDAGGEPLHERQITDRAIELGYRTDGQTPERTVNRILNEHPDLFEPLGYGRYRRRSKESSQQPSLTSPEVEDAAEAVAQRAGRRTAGQGFQMSAAVRREVERHAMMRAIMHYEALGWNVEDVSLSQTFDLRCTHPSRNELRVEVKGTTGDGSNILLTPNEVEHARSCFPGVALFVVSGIEVTMGSGENPSATGGTETVHQPWNIDAGVLRPVGYAYVPPVL